MVELTLKKKTLWPLFMDGSSASRLEPLRGGSLLWYIIWSIRFIGTLLGRRETHFEAKTSKTKWDLIGLYHVWSSQKSWIPMILHTNCKLSKCLKTSSPHWTRDLFSSLKSTSWILDCALLPCVLHLPSS